MESRINDYWLRQKTIMNSSLRHVGIVVRDIENAIKFWEDIFEFEVRVNQIEKGTFIEKLLGLPGICVQTVKMKSDTDTEIELLKFSSVSNEDVWGGRVDKVGLTHIALNIDDLNSTLKKLFEYGFSPIHEPQISLDGKVKVCYIEVIEGLLLELVEKL